MHTKRHHLFHHMVQGKLVDNSIQSSLLLHALDIHFCYGLLLMHDSLLTRSIGSAQIKNIVSSETKGTPSTNASSAAVPFKARTMPNFKALHGKISSKACDTPVAVDKENSSAAANNANESKRRLSGKGLYFFYYLFVCYFYVVQSIL